MRPRLFGFEIAWAEAAMGAIFPEGSALAHGITRMKPGAFLDDMLADVWIETSLGLRATLWIIALAPLFILRRFATITSLSAEQREELLDGLLTSRIYAVRQLVAGFKAMGSLCLSQSREIRKQMNWSGRSPASLDGVHGSRRSLGESRGEVNTPSRVLETSSLVRVKVKHAEDHEHAAQ